LSKKGKVKAEADPCGMTTKKAKANTRAGSRSEKQIPRGNDRKKSTHKSRGNSKGESKD